MHLDEVYLKAEESRAEKVNEIINEQLGRYGYVFEYGDESGEYYAKLEHENNWGGLPFVRINKH